MVRMFINSTSNVDKTFAMISLLVSLLSVISAHAEGQVYQLDLGKDVPVKAASAPGALGPQDFVSVHVQGGLPFQALEPLPTIPYCTFYLDPMSRHIFAHETFHLVPESLFAEIYLLNGKAGSQTLEMKLLSKGKSELYMIRCEDKSGARSFSDVAKREQLIKDILGELARNFAKVPKQDWAKLQRQIALELNARPAPRKTRLTRLTQKWWTTSKAIKGSFMPGLSSKRTSMSG
jgi:hypothetical protein